MATHYDTHSEIIWNGKNVEAFRAAVCRLMPWACVTFNSRTQTVTIEDRERTFTLQPGDMIESKVRVTTWSES